MIKWSFWSLLSDFSGDWLLKSYLYRTRELRKGEDSLFLSFRKKHEKVVCSSLARWVRTGLAMAGINISVFKAHSIRGASTSKLASLHLPVEAIMAKASWKSVGTFRKFYQKQIIEEKDIAQDLLKEFVLNK